MATGKQPKKGGSSGDDVNGGWSVQRVRWMGRAYDIPVDANGYVPMEAMVMRFQEIGNGRDRAGTSSRIIYPEKATPMDIVEWWADPSSCDVDGIDTKNSRVYDVSGIRGKEMRRVQSRIGIVTPSQEEQRRIRQIIANAFTAKELDAMTRGPSFVIRTVKDNGRSYGYYLMRGDGVAVPIITLEEGVTADSVIHETAHHARTTRPKGRITSTAYPQKTDGSFDTKAFSRMSESQKRKAREDEEKATTAEATARSRTDPHPSGYWDRAGGREAYLQDRKTLAGNCKGKDCTLKGVPAVKTVEKEYGNLNIAMAKLISPKPDAGQKKQTNESGHGKKPLMAAVSEDAQKATKKQGAKGNSRNPKDSKNVPKDSNKNPKGNGNRGGKK